MYLGFSHYKHRRELIGVLRLSWWPWGRLTTFILIIFELIIGVMFVLGIYTQLAALLTALMCVEFLILRNKFQHQSIPPKIFYALLLGASLSLFITGAGVLAFDLPI